MALYFNLYLQHEWLVEQKGSFGLLWSIIMKDKNGVFPDYFDYSTVDDHGHPTKETRELFGKLISQLEGYVQEDKNRAIQQLVMESEDQYYKFGGATSMVCTPDACPRDRKKKHFGRLSGYALHVCPRTNLSSDLVAEARATLQPMNQLPACKLAETVQAQLSRWRRQPQLQP